MLCKLMVMFVFVA